MSGARLVLLVARREVREGIRGRQFLVSSVVVLVLLAGVLGLNVFLGGKADTVTIGVVGPPPPRLASALHAPAKPLDRTVKLRRYADAAAARDAVAHDKIGAAFAANGRRLLVRSDSNGTTVAIATSAARTAFLAEQARHVGVTPAQARAVLASPVAVARVEPAGETTSSTRTFALVTTIVLFVALSIYGQSVMMGVVQEKATRIVEVLLAALRPRHLLAGKVVGIGLLGLSQVALIALVALAAGLAGAVELPSVGRTAPLAIVWFLLGFAFYAVAFATAGALVSRVEDAAGVSAPVTMTMLVCYLTSFAALANPDGPLATVLTLLPLSAPFALPARAATTAIPIWQYVLSVVLMLAAIWLLVRAAGRIYELALLRTGPRVPFREAFRSLRGRYAAAAR